MHFLITNSVPLNGGDEALLRALILGLTRRFGPTTRVSVLCKNLNLCRTHLPDITFAADLDFAANDTERSDALAFYHSADAVISAPGGFFHDFYAIEPRLKGLEFAVSLGKPVFLAAQSVGPFFKPESLTRVREVFNTLTKICVRDDISVTHLLAAGVHPDRIVETTDLAFLWHTLAPEVFRTPRSPVPTHIGLCIRPWPLKDTASIEATVASATALARHLLADHPDRRLTFISTCQGVPGYWDDSKLSQQVADRLGPTFAARVHVDTLRRQPVPLMNEFGKLDALISMRLHGCLLAMLAGTPAMGLAYESKTPEIYTQLGLSQYQLDFKSPAAAWIGAADTFLTDLPAIHAALPGKLRDLSHRATLTLDAIAEAFHQ